MEVNMRKYQYLNESADFRLEDPELTSYLYFPLANENGVMASVTPTLHGDNKMGQNSFLLSPVSVEELHNSKSARNFWCKIEGKEPWSVTGNSCSQQAKLFRSDKDKTSLTAGVMWHEVERYSVEHGLKASVLSSVPSSADNVELMKVTIQNGSKEEMEVTPIAAIPMYARSADNYRDHRHVTSLLHRIKTTEYGVLVNPTLTFDERGHKMNEVVYGVFGATKEGTAPEGFYKTVEAFIGEGGSFEQPKAIFTEEGKPDQVGSYEEGQEALGGLVFPKVLLKEGEEVSYLIVMGYGDSEEGLVKNTCKFFTPDFFDRAVMETKEYWNQKINIHYHTGNREFDHYMHWVNFQPMLRRIYGCSFLPHHDYGKGGRGWRDLWQDCLALLMMNPSSVRSMLYDNFAGVRMDGTNATIIGTKQGEFIADRNNITRVWMDHGVWPMITTNLYLKQSGDLAFLLEKNTYFKDMQACRGEGKDNSWKECDGKKVRTKKGEEYQGTLLEHLLLQNLTAFYDVGEHNHMKLRGADWNDALDMAKERGESVAFTAAYALNFATLAELLEKLLESGIEKISVAKEMEFLFFPLEATYEDINKKQELLEQYCKSVKEGVEGSQVELSIVAVIHDLKMKSEWIKNHIRETEWLSTETGYHWFNGYYDNHGARVEGEFHQGVRMMLTSQVFTIMSGVATEEQISEVIKAADHYLYEESMGGYRLNTNFQEVKLDLGRMFGFAYGHKENGAVFSHMAIMYANALYQRGYIKEGYRVIDSLLRHCSDFEVSRIYPGIPEYIGENGRGLYHYLTGSASWLLLTVFNEMFGIKGDFGNLCLEPKLVKEQFDEDSKASVDFCFANRKLEVTYHNPHGLEANEYQVKEILLDGVKLEGDKGIILRNYIEALSEKEKHLITVTLG